MLVYLNVKVPSLYFGAVILKSSNAIVYAFIGIFKIPGNIFTCSEITYNDIRRSYWLIPICRNIRIAQEELLGVEYWGRLIVQGRAFMEYWD